MSADFGVTRERVAVVLAPYGIEVTDDLWKRYHTDALVRALVHIVVGQSDVMKTSVKEAFMKGVEEGAEKVIGRCHCGHLNASCDLPSKGTT